MAASRLQCGVRRAQCEVWSVKCEVWSVKEAVRSVKCGLWSVKCEWSVECEVRSEKCEAWSLECEVWSGKEAVRSEKCEVRSVKFGVWRKQWEVRSEKCEVRSEKCEVWSVKCEVWSVKECWIAQPMGGSFGFWFLTCGYVQTCLKKQIPSIQNPNYLYWIKLAEHWRYGKTRTGYDVCLNFVCVSPVAGRLQTCTNQIWLGCLQLQYTGSILRKT